MEIQPEALDLVSIGTICDTINCSKNVAYSLLSEKPDDDKITAWRVGNRWKVTRVSLEQYLIRHSDIS